MGGGCCPTSSPLCCCGGCCGEKVLVGDWNRPPRGEKVTLLGVVDGGVPGGGLLCFRWASKSVRAFGWYAYTTTSAGSQGVGSEPQVYVHRVREAEPTIIIEGASCKCLLDPDDRGVFQGAPELNRGKCAGVSEAVIWGRVSVREIQTHGSRLLSILLRVYGRPSEALIARYTVECQLPNFLLSTLAPEISSGTSVW